MYFRIVFSTLLATALILSPGFSRFDPFTRPALAEGRGGDVGTPKGPGIKPRKAIPRPILNLAPGKAKPKKVAAPKAPKYLKEKDFSTVPDIREFQSELDDYAQGDNLKGLSTTRKRLIKFNNALAKLYLKYGRTKKLDVNKIHRQLSKYANLSIKKYPALRSYARGILKAFTIFRLEAKAREKLENFAKAEGYGKRFEASIEYNDAVDEYTKAVNELPADMRPVFPPLDKITLK